MVRQKFSCYAFYLFFLIYHLHISSAADMTGAYQFDSKSLGEAIDIIPIDLDEDGNHELVFIHPQGLDVRFSQNHYEFFASFRIPVDRSSVTPLITGSLDTLRFLFHKQTSDSSIYRLLTWASGRGKAEKRIDKFLTFTGHDVDGDGKYHQTCWYGGRIKTNKGNIVSLFVLNSAFDMGKRSLMTVDESTGEILNEFLVGPQIRQVEIDRALEPGRCQIIASTYAPDNFVSFNGFRDNESFVFSFDSNLQLKWAHRMGGLFSGANACSADMDGDGTKETVAFGFNYRAEKNYIKVLNPADGQVIVEREVPYEISDNHPFYPKNFCQDLNGNGFAQLIVGGRDGFVRTYDNELRTEKISDCFQVPIRLVAVENFYGGDAKEIACWTDDNRLVILDADLRTLATQSYPSRPRIAVVRTDRVAQLLVATGVAGKPEFMHFNLLKLRKIPVPVALANRQKGILFLLPRLLILAILLLVAVQSYSTWRARYLLFSFLHQSGFIDQLLIIKKNGRIVRFGKDWETTFHLDRQSSPGKHFSDLFISSNYQSIKRTLDHLIRNRHPKFVKQVKIKQGEAAVTLELKSFYIRSLKIYAVEMSDKSRDEKQRQILSWIPAAQRLAHSIKNPLTSVKLNAEELQDIIYTKYNFRDRQIDEYFCAIIGQVNRLTRMSDGFMRFIQLDKLKLQPVDVNSLIEDILTNLHDTDSNKFKVELQLGENLPNALTDPTQFAFIFKTIFYNAVESLQEKGRISIKTHYTEAFPTGEQYGMQHFVELEMHDNGCGIPEEYKNRIFQPFFTLKEEGTGLGLSLVKRIIDESDGEIEIDSHAGIGTTVTIRFQVAD